MANKLIFVDPNKVNNSPSGLFKPEDMFIYVNLEAEKKPKSVISTDSSGTFLNNSNINGKNSFKFIEGSKEPGREKNALTTNYTRLTTVLKDENGYPSSESFGITDISIDFNTAFVPQINIEFVDVFGSTLFEQGENSRFALFFELPYPLFKLKVKGYFGPAVEYCLHLTKFASRFNSQTGNFEITCNFIGYTFAFLSDMLLGYLRAAPETRLGRELFEKEKAKDSELITINELIRNMELAEKTVSKLAANNDNVQKLNAVNELLVAYDDYISILDEFTTSFDIPITTVTASPNEKFYVFKINPNFDLIKSKYISKLNNKATASNKIISSTDAAFLLPTDSSIKIQFINNFKKGDLSRLLTDDLNNKYLLIEKYLAENEGYLIIDFSELYSTINQKKENLKKLISSLNTTVSTLIDSQLKSIIGFRPTLRNVVKIFTVHAEIFMELIRQTSVKAMNDPYRKSQMDRLIGTTSLNVASGDKVVYPWPEYNVNYEEAWIGEAVGLIPEVILVNEILDGLLKSGKIDEDFGKLLTGSEAYSPTNIFDLPIFKNLSPYDELLSDDNFSGSIEKIFLLSTLRLFNYSQANIGDANFKADKENIYELFGKFEALNIAESLKEGDYNGVYNLLLQYGNADVNAQLSGVTSIMKNGHADFLLPNGVKEVIIEDNDKYRYVYLRENEEKPTIENSLIKQRIYLPNFANLSKTARFYSNGIMKDYSELKNEFNQDNFEYPQYLGFGFKEQTNGQSYQQNFDDGSIFCKLIEPFELDNQFVFPNEDSLITKKGSKWGNITDSLSPDTNAELAKLSFVNTNSEGKSSIYNSEFRVNDMRYFLVDSPYNSWLKDNIINSSVLFYKNTNIYNGDMSTHQIWYGVCPMVDSSLFEADIYIDNQIKTYGSPKEVFSPLAYTIADIIKDNKLELIDAVGLSSPTNIVSTPDLYGEENYFIESNYQPAISKDNTIIPEYINYQGIPTDVSIKLGKLNRYGQETDKTINSLLHSNCKVYLNGLNLTTMSVPTGNFVNEAKWDSDSYGVNLALSEVSNFFNRTGITTALGGIGLYFKPAMFLSFLASSLGEEEYQTIFLKDIMKTVIGSNSSAIETSMSGVLSKSSAGKPIGLTFPTAWTFGKNKIQLFGSEFYFEQIQNENYQDTVRIRSLLFLRLLPLIGNFGKSQEIPEDLFNLISTATKDGVIRSNILKNPGLQYIPYSYILAIGAEAWYLNNTTANIYYKNPEGKILIPGITTLPTKNQRWMSSNTIQSDEQALPLSFGNYSLNYVNGLPKQYRDLCLEEFLNWSDLQNIQTLSWNFIRKRLEIFDFDTVTDKDAARLTWKNNWINFVYTREYLSNNFYNYANRSVKDVPYIILQPYIKNNVDFKTIKINGNGDIPTNLSTSYCYDYNCILNHMSDINEIYFNFLGKTKILAKYTGLPKSSNLYETPTIKKDDFDSYYRGFFTELNKQLTQTDISTDSQNKLKQSVFGSTDNKLIRLNIYRQLSAIYLKWIGGEGKNKFISCVSGTNQNNEDISLIDRFRFIDRAYNDIGDKLLINPFVIRDYIRGNFNESLYNLLGGKILAKNNIDFIPLPTFINFRDEEELKNMFRTFPYMKENDGSYGLETVNGPTFVCMYIGQTSTNLDIPYGANKNDSFMFFDAEGNPSETCPIDLTDSSGDPIPVFLVNYGTENQSYFTDIRLNQTEFNETDESLQIISDLFDNKKSFSDQSLFNVYSTRSYSAEIEMLGDLAIQPFMYFQLNNIPMFRGAYMIIKASHKVTPHHIITRFKGVRIKKVRTPLVDEEFIYLSILNAFSGKTSENISISEGSLEYTDFVPGVYNGETIDTSDDLWISDGNLETGSFMIGTTIESFNPRSPADSNYFVTSPIGIRDLFGLRMHNGVDLNTPFNSNLYAIEDGKLHFIGLNVGGYGLYLITVHNFGDRTIYALYAHLSSISETILSQLGLTDETLNSKLPTSYYKDVIIKQEIKVNKGDIIAKSGGLPNTTRGGATTGPHLHFEIRHSANNIETNQFYNISPFINKTSRQIDAVTKIADPIYVIKELKSNITTSSTSTTPNSNDMEKNIKEVKQILKNKGLTKQETAAIMGNIYSESKFNPLARRENDGGSNYDSVGLIQWNSRYNTAFYESGTVPGECTPKYITIKDQLAYLFNMNSYKEFMKPENHNKNDVTDSTFSFAAFVEKCTGCNDIDSSTNQTRINKAKEFLNRFNKTDDDLYWG